MSSDLLLPGAQTTTTPLHALHLELGAKMVPFAGYDMPVQYPAGIMAEHHQTRNAAGLFDVSHMGQLRLTGNRAATALETLVPVDVVDLAIGQQRYALFTNDQGGILDDLMITNTTDGLLLVVNAACKDADLKHLQNHLGNKISISVLRDRALLALQGPKAAEVLGKYAAASTGLTFMTAAAMTIAGIPCFVSRSGYTGEDGFEISVPDDQAETLARKLLSSPWVEPIGLGARDSLRLEAGLCLYGHDLDLNTTPVEAGLTWALSRSRRSGGARAGGYAGDHIIMAQLANGVARRRVGLQPGGRAPVRAGVKLVDQTGLYVGTVTSGGFGPTVGNPVAMGYVDAGQAQAGTLLNAVVRDKPRPVQVTKLPFVEQNYFRV